MIGESRDRAARAKITRLAADMRDTNRRERKRAWALVAGVALFLLACTAGAFAADETAHKLVIDIPGWQIGLIISALLILLCFGGVGGGCILILIAICVLILWALYAFFWYVCVIAFIAALLLFIAIMSGRST